MCNLYLMYYSPNEGNEMKICGDEEVKELSDVSFHDVTSLTDRSAQHSFFPSCFLKTPTYQLTSWARSASAPSSPTGTATTTTSPLRKSRTSKVHPESYLDRPISAAAFRP